FRYFIVGDLTVQHPTPSLGRRGSFGDCPADGVEELVVFYQGDLKLEDGARSSVASGAQFSQPARSGSERRLETCHLLRRASGRMRHNLRPRVEPESTRGEARRGHLASKYDLRPPVAHRSPA